MERKFSSFILIFIFLFFISTVNAERVVISDTIRSGIPMTPDVFHRLNSVNHDYSLNSPIIIADSLGKLSSFKELLQLQDLKNSHIFIDVWASWCFPCIDEFAFNKGVDSFLISHGIKKLYLSLDDLRNKNKWLSAVEKYQLGGVHVLAGYVLTMELKEKLGITTSSIAIPRYMLFNKETKEFTALSIRPSDGPFFYSAIDFILNSK